ncbi:hypothetical protein U9M48_009979 [Paspalum notatum var. saurae]|uniref:Major facilitator superfamily (MFS) profile domain-containing protein n=1 Tax=Paspalum notatum var. saurae TaxID=547442 RepID=A0AAQ3WFR9_PASNO
MRPVRSRDVTQRRRRGPHRLAPGRQAPHGHATRAASCLFHFLVSVHVAICPPPSSPPAGWPGDLRIALLRAPHHHQAPAFPLPPSQAGGQEEEEEPGAGVPACQCRAAVALPGSTYRLSVSSTATLAGSLLVQLEASDCDANMATYTTDDALTRMGFGRFQALVLVYAGMGWVAEAMELMLLSFLGPFIREEWNVSSDSESLLSSVVFAGMLLGACVWGFLSDNYGRRILLTGFKHEGLWNPCNLPKFEAEVVLPALNWRWLLVLTALPCFLLIPFFGLTPESPRYLCVQNRMSDATAVLERMANANQSDLPPGVLVYHRETKVDHDSTASASECLLPVTEKECTADNAVNSKSGSLPALRMLLSRNLLRSTLLLWFVFYANSFAYYGLVLLTSQLSGANRSCASDVTFGLHQNDTNLYKDTFITSLAEIPGLILSAVLVDWFGRKATMWSMMFACCAFLGPLIHNQNELLTTALLFGARACAMGSFTVLCLYAPEVYPTSVRSTGAGIATAIGRIGGVVCPIVAVAMLRSCHQMEALIVFEVVLCLAGVACMFFPVETKGRGMD